MRQQNTGKNVTDEDRLDDLLEDWTVHRNEYILVFGTDGILCIIVLVIISQESMAELVARVQ